MTFLPTTLRLLLACVAVFLASCGGGGGDAAPAPPAAATAPVITTAPANLSIAVGASAIFSVTASGTAPLTYQWTRNGADIAGATAASYTLAAASASDSGAVFAVRVANAAGTATSSAATLTVVPAPVLPVPPVITGQPAPAQVAAGQPASFSVAATGTALTYQWRRNGVDIAGATSASYTVLATTLADDQAVFSVRIANAAGNVLSTGATLTVAATTAPLPAGTTDRYLTPYSPLVLETFTNTPAGSRYLVDPLAPTLGAALSPAPVNGSIARGVLGGEVDTVAGMLRHAGVRHLLYNVGASDLYRLDLDRAAVLPTTATLVAPTLATCDIGHRHLGSSLSGQHIVYALLGDTSACLGGTYYAVDVGPAGNATRVALPGVPLDVTLDASGEIDGYLSWTSASTLAYQDAATGIVTAVAVPTGTPATNNGAFSTPNNARNAIRTRGGIVFRDGNGVVWRFDKATKSLSAPLWRQLNGIGSVKVSVERDALLVGDVELLPGAAGPGSGVSGDPTLWRVEDTLAAPVMVIAKGPSLVLNSLRFTRDYVLLTDARAEHVAVSKLSGAVQWSGPNQVGTGRVETVSATTLSNTVFFAGTPLGGVPRLIGLDLATQTRPPVLDLTLAGSALSDELPLGSWFGISGHGMPLSHLLAWRRASGRTDLSQATLVWVDMANGTVVASSGSLPNVAYTGSSIGLVFGHAGIGSADDVLGSVAPVLFTFGIASGSLNTFTPPAN